MQSNELKTKTLRNLEKTSEETTCQKYKKWMLVFVLCLGYIGSNIYISIVQDTAMAGIVAQVQLMISVYLVVKVQKIGYRIAVILNGSAFLIDLHSFAVLKIYSAAAGMIITLCALIICSIIVVYNVRLVKKLEIERGQKEEIAHLYRELKQVEDQLRIRNDQLTKANSVMIENESMLNQLAFFDVLTNLPNRKMIYTQLDLMIEARKDTQEAFAVVFIDLDDFKKVNDTMGHYNGDSLLKAVTSKFQENLHEDDLLGRLGGDEFALIIRRELSEENIRAYAESLRQLLQTPVRLENAEVTVSASFGISCYPKDGNTASELLRYSDIAMYRAKESGKNGVQFFSKRMKDTILQQIDMENQLQSALENKELFLVFQPQYYADSKELYGFEALVRWNSEKLGMQSPAKFILLAEELGYIIPMGEWILRTACRALSEIQRITDNSPVMSVNISILQIMDPAFVTTVQRIIRETGVNAKFLKFELTESVFITSMTQVIATMKCLNKIGIQFSLDDFGVGYSSLNYLQQLPIDTLKIDKSFIETITGKKGKKQIVGAIIALMHQLELTVIAEGVENEVQLVYLQRMKCDVIQGYYWGKPIDQKQLIHFLK